MNNFDFIADPKFKSLLVRDFAELQVCINNEVTKSSLILSGSIIEAILLEFFTHNLPEGISSGKLLKMSLTELINEAEKIKLISQKSKDLSTVVKNYRNLIHPGREVRTNEEFDFETAIVSFSLVKIILKEIKDNYITKYGYTAIDILNKINVDSSTYSIYEKLVNKLNAFEKSKLLDLLVEQSVEEYDITTRSKLDRYIKPLKKHVDEQVITNHCKQMLSEVEKGKETIILAKFEIFGDNLNSLNNDEKDLVLAYIYNKANSISAWNENIKNTRFRDLFTFLGMYLYSNDIKDRFFELLKKIVKNYKYSKEDKWYFTTAYDNMLEYLNELQKEKCNQYIIDSFSKEDSDNFFSALEEDRSLPF